MATNWKKPRPFIPDADYPALRPLLECLSITSDQRGRKEIWEKINCFPHTVRELCSDQEWDAKFICHEYALGLAHDPEYSELEKSGNFVSEDTIRCLIEMELLVPRPGNQCEAGDILTYEDDADIQHTAVVLKPHKLLRSKWTTGKVYEHGMLEVPACYGNPSTAYAPPDRNLVIGQLKRMWAQRLRD